MMISKTTCTGCGTCYVSCPIHCIEMKENKTGQIIPVIDKSKCLHCNLCKNLCPQDNTLKEHYPMSCYVAWSKFPEDYIYSASGGVAATFARYQLRNNGSVYGCDYNENCELRHSKIYSEQDIIKMQSSKYSQSIAYDSFEEIKMLLDNKESVVFIGTPCQVAALLKYLRKKYDSLITVDLVCHGTPPNTYLKKHLNELKIKAPYQKIRFRGEFDQMLTIWQDNNIVYQKDRNKDTYFYAFYKNMISYDSCYSCKYAQPKRISDITIGDFWGLGELHNIEKISERPSLILVNTQNGQIFFNCVCDYLIFEKREVKEGIKGNGRLNAPPGNNRSAKIFQRLYRFSFLGFNKSVNIVRFILKINSKFSYISKQLLIIKNKIVRKISKI